MPNYFNVVTKTNWSKYVAILLLSILLSCTLLVQNVHATPNSTINFQGKLVDKTTGTNSLPSCIIAGSANDTCDFRVSIYSDASGGTLLWREPHMNVELGDTNNVFDLSLNSICNSWQSPSGSCSGSGINWGSDPTVYIEIEFDPDGNGDFVSPEIFSRKLFSSVPYALHAGTADTTTADLDNIYANDSDKTLNVNNVNGLSFSSTTAGDIAFNLLSTGNFRINDQAADLTPFVIDSTGNVGIGSAIPAAALEIDRSTSSDVVIISNAGSGTALNIQFTSNATTSSGVKISNTAAGAITDAIDVSDPEIVNAINLGENNIVSNTGGTVSWNNATGRELLRLTDLSTNFGATLDGGAFISRNSYVGEEFSRERPDITTNGSQVWGDFQQFGVDQTSGCTFSILDNAVNGIGRIGINVNGNRSCLAYHSSAVGVAHSIFNAANLPVVVMKVRPYLLSGTEDFWVGMGDDSSANFNDPGNGIYFANNGGTNWLGVTRSGNTSTTINCNLPISTTQFALLKIETRSTTDVRFYVDNDVSNGVSWTYCGSSATNVPTINLTSMLKFASNNTVARYLDIDFYRVWQDDSPTTSTASEQQPMTLNYANGEQQDNTDFIINQKGIFTITDNTGSELFSLDNSGNLKIPGTLDAKVVRAERIEGMEVYTNTINSLTNELTQINNQISGLEEQQQTTQPATNKLVISEAEVKVSLQVLGELSLQGNLTVVGDSIFNGDAKFNFNSTFNNITVNGQTRFNSAPQFNADTAGVAIIKKDTDQVEVKYQQPFNSEPITVVSPVDNSDPVNYNVTNQTKNGFNIKVSPQASKDTKFNWVSINSNKSAPANNPANNAPSQPVASQPVDSSGNQSNQKNNNPPAQANVDSTGQ